MNSESAEILEVPLAGGNMAGAVVKVGDTVRRPVGPQTPTVHRLLAHLRAQGVDWVPRVHGIDSKGREILDYIEGEVAHGEPPYLRKLETLTTIARRLREWHDATATFERKTDDVWWWPGKEPAEVICHVDFAPYNHVYRDGVFVGAIDFDVCYPGPRLWDLAYTAYRYVPLVPHSEDDVPDGPVFDLSVVPERTEYSLPERLARLDTFLAAYAGEDAALLYPASALLGWAVPRLVAMADWSDAQESAAVRDNGRMYRAHSEWIAAGGLGPAQQIDVVDLRV